MKQNKKSDKRVKRVRSIHQFSERGFTLVEIMVVVVIISIIALFAAPEFKSFGPNMRLKAAARNLHNNLQKMKVEAIKRNSEVVMLISADPVNSYRIFIDEDSSGVQNGTEEWFTFTDDSGDASPDTDYDTPNNTVLTSSTSPSMGFNSRGLLLDPTTNVEVLPDGQNGFLFTLNNDIGSTYTVSVYIAGKIATQKL